ncbi:MAG: inositol monophosphatase family protein [Kiritimatiellales bacterium]
MKNPFSSVISAVHSSRYTVFKAPENKKLFSFRLLFVRFIGTFCRMIEIPNQILLEVCTAAAHTTGNFALKNIHRRKEVAQQFDHDIKLVMDSESQHIAEKIILEKFPAHSILGEESATENTGDYEWIIDPIDGTANYTNDFPFWCCSIAVRRSGKILAGCVYIPPLNDCYIATIDGPALCNGEPIHPSGIADLKHATLFTGLTKDIDSRTIEFFTAAAPRVNKIRILGAAAIDICHVACGRSDAFFEAGLYLWDVAAAGLIAERAGACCTATPRAETHGVRFLCSTPEIHAGLKQLVEKYF